MAELVRWSVVVTFDHDDVVTFILPAERWMTALATVADLLEKAGHDPAKVIRFSVNQLPWPSRED